MINAKSILLSFFVFVNISAVSAQEAALDVMDTKEPIVVSQEKPIEDELELIPNKELLSSIELMYERVKLKEPSFNLGQIGSVFLTNIEQNIIASARKLFVTRMPSEEEFINEQNSDQDNVQQSPREVVLNGLLYLSNNDWVVWINSVKITPKNLPPEIIDIRVSKDFIRLKWLDVQTNQIFPIKLKAKQKFNLDTRIFLPG